MELRGNTKPVVKRSTSLDVVQPRSHSDTMPFARCGRFVPLYPSFFLGLASLLPSPQASVSVALVSIATVQASTPQSEQTILICLS